MRIKIGDIVKSKVELRDRYYNYPIGCNLNIFPPDTLFRVISIPPKVCIITGKDGYDSKPCFLNLVPIDATNDREIVVSTNFCNVRKQRNNKI